MRARNILIAAGMLCLPLLAFAYETPADLVGKALQASTVAISNNLQSLALRLLFAFLVLQWAIDGIGMLGNEITIERVIGKFGMAVLWGAFCLWLLDGAGNGQTNLGHFMQSTVDYFIGKAGEWVGTNGGSFDSVDILNIGLVAYGKIVWAVGKATATNVVNAVVAVALPQTTFIIALVVFAVICVIVGSCAYIALKVFLVKIQVGIWIAVSPIAVAMLGLRGLRDMGFSPLKALLGLVFRIIVLAAIVSTLQIMAENFSNHIDSLSWGLAADIITPLIAAAFGFFLIAFITHQADEIAAAMSAGTLTMNSGNLASSIATGVSAGMAGAAGLAALQAMTGGSMLDALKTMRMPASGRGAGGAEDKGSSQKKIMEEGLKPVEYPAGYERNAQSTQGTEKQAATKDSNAEKKSTAASGEPAGIAGDKVKEALRNLGNRAGGLNQQLQSDRVSSAVQIDTRTPDA